jgi:tetratricopeptide (TPR) repeat protein
MFATAAMAAGCQGLYSFPGQTGMPPPSSKPAIPVEEARSNPLSTPTAERSTLPAVNSLINKARGLAAGGKYAEAESTLDRALRIDSRDPNIYLALAEVYIAQGEVEQVAPAARRGLERATDGSVTHARLEEILLEY